jgi:hypothetical protein
MLRLLVPKPPGTPRLAQADAEVLIKDHGGEAYGEARWRERDGRQSRKGSGR